MSLCSQPVREYVTCGATFRGFAGVYGSLHIVVVYSADCCRSVALLCLRIIAILAPSPPSRFVLGQGKYSLGE